MLDLILAMRSYFPLSEEIYYWHFLYFGLGYAMCSLVISLAHLAAVVKERFSRNGRPRWYAHLLIVLLSMLAIASLFAVTAIFRAVALGHINAPQSASISAMAGGFIQVLVLFLLNKKKSTYRCQ